MYGRRSVWLNAQVQEKIKAFVLVADEVYALHTGRGPEAEFFQNLARQGYAGGRAGTTQQGIYCFTATGMVLASDNTRDPQRLVRTLDTALAKWQQLSAAQKQTPQPFAVQPTGRSRGEMSYPKDGLVLRQYVRDLGPEKRRLGDLLDPWNTDTVWFTGAEARQLVPAEIKVGAKHTVPDFLIHRLARLHLVDTVVGQSFPFPPNSIEQATLTAAVTAVQGELVTVQFQGATRAAAGNRGLETRLQGAATFDRQRGRFTAFDLIATGTRRGGNFPPYIRGNTVSGRIGFAFILAGDFPVDRVAPAFFAAYGWR